MENTFKNTISKILYKFYTFIFKEEPSQNIKVFIENLWYVAIGFGFYAVFAFSFQVAAGRFLGPSEYGKYALVQAISMFLLIPMNLGVSTALIKYNAEKEDKKRQSEIIFTSCFIVVVLSFACSLIFFAFASYLSKLFGISMPSFQLAILFALLGNLYITIISIFRSLHKNKEFSFFQALYGFLVVFLLLFFIVNKYVSFRGAVFATYLAYATISLLSVIRLYQYFSFSPSKLWFKKILQYGSYASIGVTAFAFLSNFNELVINKYLSVSEVGIYNAYYFPSVGILSIFLSIFVTVFFSTASKYPKKEMILKKIDRILPRLFLMGVPVIFVVEFVMLKLYGSKYPIDYVLMSEFILTGFIIFSYGFYDWTFCSEGVYGVRLSALVVLVVAAVNIALGLAMIPKIGIHGAVISLGTGYLAGIACFQFLKKKIA